MSSTPFKVGGSLADEHAAVYVERQADHEALAHLRTMDYLLVIEPRQQGKTSLINHLARHPALGEMTLVYIDMSTPDHSTEAAWYRTLCPRILRQLRSFISRDQWPAIPQDSAGWRDFLYDVAVFATDAHQRVIIALDEIGTVTFPGTTEFFSILRDVYNSRQAETEFKQLAFLLAGAFHARDLIKDDKISPFNIAQRVRLTDFTFAQVRELVQKGVWPGEQAEALSERIYYWTNGQPYLTQLLCSCLGDNAEPSDVDAAVERLHREDVHHLPRVLEQLNSDVKLREYVSRIQAGMRIKFFPRENPRQAQLELIGIVKADDEGFVAIRNRIYEQMLTEIKVRSKPDLLLISAHRFFKRAGFQLASVVEPSLYCFDPASTNLERLLPPTVYVRFLPEEVLDSDQVLVIRDQVKHVDAEASVVLAITDQRPTNQGWAQIGTLQMGAFTILPIESALLSKGLATGREQELLRTEVENRLGDDYDPYDVRDPVAGVFSFFGRDALVEKLLKRIADGRPIGIFGLRKLGKSSLLSALRDRAPFPVATVNLQTVDRDINLTDLYQRILDDWAQWTRVRFELAWEPPTISTNAPTSAFVCSTRDLLEHIKHAHKEARLGLFLDEVELIVPRRDSSGSDLIHYLALLRALRGLIDENVPLSLVVASLNPSINDINAWGSEQNPTFSFFQEMLLPPLKREDCDQLVCNIGQQIGLAYSEDSLREIYDLSGAHPFLARQFCSLLYKQRDREGGCIEVTEILPAVQTFIYDRATASHLAGIWEDVGNVALWGTDDAQVNQSLLCDLARADGPMSEDNILNGPSADARRVALFNMERYHIIHQEQSGAYTIRFGLLRTWLRRRKLGLE